MRRRRGVAAGGPPSRHRCCCRPQAVQEAILLAHNPSCLRATVAHTKEPGESDEAAAARWGSMVVRRPGWAAGAAPVRLGCRGSMRLPARRLLCSDPLPLHPPTHLPCGQPLCLLPSAPCAADRPWVHRGAGARGAAHLARLRGADGTAGGPVGGGPGNAAPGAAGAMPHSQGAWQPDGVRRHNLQPTAPLRLHPGRPCVSGCWSWMQGSASRRSPL